MAMKTRSATHYGYG